MQSDVKSSKKFSHASWVHDWNVIIENRFSLFTPCQCFRNQTSTLAEQSEQNIDGSVRLRRRNSQVICKSISDISSSVMLHQIYVKIYSFMISPITMLFTRFLSQSLLILIAKEFSIFAFSRIKHVPVSSPATFYASLWTELFLSASITTLRMFQGRCAGYVMNRESYKIPGCSVIYASF